MLKLLTICRRVISAYAASGILLGCTFANCAETIEELRNNVLNADSDTSKAKAYEALFRDAGLDGLKPLTDDADVGIALQANWEAHKKLVKRPKPIQHRTDWIYDPSGIKEFVDYLEKRTKSPVPDWWREAALGVEVFPGKHHAFRLNLKSPVPKLREVKTIGRVTEGVNVERIGERLRFTQGVWSGDISGDIATYGYPDNFAVLTGN